MNKSITMIALAGIAFSASAQDFSLSIAGPTSISEGAVFTVDVFGDANVGTHMLGGGFSLVATGGGILIQDISWVPSQWSAFNTDNGYGGNGNHNGVIFGQLVIFGIPGFDVPAAGSDLGNRIGSFQITLEPQGFGQLDMTLVAADPFALQTISIANGETFSSADGNLTLNGISVIVYPTPSSLALLGLGGLAAGRRRR
ncbi:MAG: hypothetical protein JKX70_01340 [Phycisphaerales bacterium]|nr:hypothetical protein [Phycisphaerales bacterium]